MKVELSLEPMPVTAATIAIEMQLGDGQEGQKGPRGPYVNLRDTHSTLVALLKSHADLVFRLPNDPTTSVLLVYFN